MRKDNRRNSSLGSLQVEIQFVHSCNLYSKTISLVGAHPKIELTTLRKIDDLFMKNGFFSVLKPFVLEAMYCQGVNGLFPGVCACISHPEAPRSFGHKENCRKWNRECQMVLAVNYPLCCGGSRCNEAARGSGKNNHKKTLFASNTKTLTLWGRNRTILNWAEIRLWRLYYSMWDLFINS